MKGFRLTSEDGTLAHWLVDLMGQWVPVMNVMPEQYSPPSRRKVRGHSGLTAWDLEVGSNITEREPV